jgi:ATP-dependent Lon protease
MKLKQNKKMNRLDKIKKELFRNFVNTSTIQLGQTRLDRIVGNEKLIEQLPLLLTQKRHLLLIGRPGVGKSLIGKALAENLPPVQEEVYVINNVQNPERPILVIAPAKWNTIIPKKITPYRVDKKILYELNYFCSPCDLISSFSLIKCPICKKEKKPIIHASKKPTPKKTQKILSFFSKNLNMEGLNLPGDYFDKPDDEEMPKDEIKFVLTPEKIKDMDLISSLPGVYVPTDEFILIYPLSLRKIVKELNPKEANLLLRADRKQFVTFYGGQASARELLGDVQHDPYGGSPEIGTARYKRIVPGAIHEAHEGVLFIDEIGTLGALQKSLLSALQEKKFTIAGKGSGTGSFVKVLDVPCDFRLIRAGNLKDLPNISTPLRSRISGEGYEYLMEDHMPITLASRQKYIQFIAQEIHTAKNIPPMDQTGVYAMLKYSQNLAKTEGYLNSFSLLLRRASGVIKAAGDLAIIKNKPFITEQEVEAALTKTIPLETQIKKYYGTYSAGLQKEQTESQNQMDYGYEI